MIDRGMKVVKVKYNKWLDDARNLKRIMIYIYIKYNYSSIDIEIDGIIIGVEE